MFRLLKKSDLQNIQTKEPRLSVSRKGKITLNRSFYEQLGKPEYVQFAQGEAEGGVNPKNGHRESIDVFFMAKGKKDDGVSFKIDPKDGGFGCKKLAAVMGEQGKLILYKPDGEKQALGQTWTGLKKI